MPSFSAGLGAYREEGICPNWVTGGSFCNEINVSDNPLAAEEIVATARTAVPCHKQKWLGSSIAVGILSERPMRSAIHLPLI